MAKKTKAKENTTYHKSKNGRYYKKITVDGKCKCRFVSKAEGEAGFGPPKKKPRKKTGSKKEVEKPTEEPVELN